MVMFIILGVKETTLDSVMELMITYVNQNQLADSMVKKLFNLPQVRTDLILLKIHVYNLAYIFRFSSRVGID